MQSAIPPLAGGLVSGFLGGILAAEYRYRRDRHREQERWLTKTKRLAEQLNNAYEAEQIAQWDRETAQQFHEDVNNLTAELPAQIRQCPVGIGERVRNLTHQYLRECRDIARMREVEAEDRTRKFRESAKVALETADTLSAAITKSRLRVGFLP